MTSVASRRVAWSLWAVVLVLASAQVALVSFIATQPTVGILLDDLGVDDARILIVAMTVIALTAVVGATVGVLVGRRQPRNPVGWLLLAAALLGITLWVLDHYVLLGGVVVPGSVPGIDWAALAIVPVSKAWSASILLAVWFFPTGRIRPARWRWALGVMLGAYAVATLVLLATPGSIFLSEIEGQFSASNPIGLPQLEGLSGRGDAIDVVVGGFALLLTLAGLVARFRRSRGVERAQLKWFLYAGAMLMVAAVLGSLTGPLVLVAYAIFPLAVPVAMAVAILRYRLYDIDRIISRTLSYALVTALLGGTYAGLVLLLGVVLRRFTAGSDLAVAGSVLVVAGLFTPLRRRVQAAVDRRFNRARYDAEQTIAAFAERLRQEVDLDTLTAELTHVVGATMQPARVSLWLRTPETGA